MFWNDGILPLLEKGLDAAALRQRVLANNLANLNTPRFRRSSVSFEEELKRARQAGEVMELSTTRRKHIASTGAAGVGPVIVKESSNVNRLDGNNVDLEREMIGLLTNQIWQNALVQQVNYRLDSWRHIISEGRR